MPQAYNDRRSGPWTLTAGQTGPHTFDFTIDAASDLRVVRRRDNSLGTAVETELTETTHYTVSVASYPGSGSITLVDAPEADDILVIEGRRPPARPGADFNTERLDADDINTQLDSVWRAIQDVARDAAGSVRVLRGESQIALPEAGDRANRVLAFGAGGDPVAGPSTTDIDTIAAYLPQVDAVSQAITQVEAVGDDLLGDDNIGALAALTTEIAALGAVSADITTVATDLSGDDTLGTVAPHVAAVSTLASSITELLSLHTNLTAILAAEGHATTASTKATEAAASATAAAASESDAESARDDAEAARDTVQASAGEIAARTKNNAHGPILSGLRWMERNPQTGGIYAYETILGDRAGGVIDDLDVEVLALETADTAEAVARAAADDALDDRVDRRKLEVLALPGAFTAPILGGMREATRRASDGGVLAYETILGHRKSGLVNDQAANGLAAGRYEDYMVPGHYSGVVRTQVRRVDSLAGTGVPEEEAPLYRPLTAGPYSARFLREVGTGLVEVLRQGKVHYVRYVTSPLATAGKVLTVLTLGQSLSLGQKDNGARGWLINQDPVWPRVAGYGGASMFASATSDDQGPRVLQVEPKAGNRSVVLDTAQLARVVSLREGVHPRDTDDLSKNFGTHSSSLAFGLLAHFCELETEVLCAHVGTGSTASDVFLKTSPALSGAHFANAMTVVQAAQDHADETGSDHEVIVVWDQGEADNDSAFTQATIESNLNSIFSDLRTDIIAITGQAAVKIVIHQCSQLMSGELGTAGLAQRALARAGTASLVATYPMKPGSSGSTHLVPATYMPRGYAAAYQIYKLFGNASYQSPDVSFSSKSGDQAVFSIAGGSGTYVIDTDTIPNMLDGWYGHTASDGSGDLTVTDFDLSGSTITVTYNRNISGTLNWGFGAKNSNGGASLMPGNHAPRVNIRDDSEFYCPMTGQIVSGWMIQSMGED